MVVYLLPHSPILLSGNYSLAALFPKRDRPAQEWFEVILRKVFIPAVQHAKPSESGHTLDHYRRPPGAKGLKSNYKTLNGPVLAKFSAEYSRLCAIFLQVFTASALVIHPPFQVSH
jgi:hypothetical protein